MSEIIKKIDEYKNEVKKEIKRRYFDFYFDFSIDGNSNKLVDLITDCNLKDSLSDLPNIPIIINITSNGGRVNTCKNLTNIIENSKTPIYTIAGADTFSAGSWLFISGHKRFIFKKSLVHFHDCFGVNIGKTQDLKEYYEYNITVKDYLVSILNERTNIPKKHIKDMVENKKELFYNMNECLKYRIADRQLTSMSELFTEILKEFNDEIIF
jgi:ATP-dependent protease ClpP protease subunit